MVCCLEEASVALLSCVLVFVLPPLFFLFPSSSPLIPPPPPSSAPLLFPLCSQVSPLVHTQDHPPTKTVARCGLTDSVRIVGAVSVPSSNPVVNGGAVAAEKSPHFSEGELCGVSSPSVRLGWSSLSLFAVTTVL